jgi:pyruvate dehydrogenase E2 component (dihydrolipoamide acetyltransferase)
MKTFYLPDLGEGLPEGEIAKWHVKEGDMVKTDDPLVSIETAKAIVEVPSPYDGKIAKLHGKEKDIIPTGSPLVDFEQTQRAETGTVAGEIKVGNEIVTEKAMSIASRAGNVKVLPAVRALAKKLNVDLSTLTPSGADGTITAEDVKKASEGMHSGEPLETLHGVRRAMSMAMAQSHAEVVPVTVMDDVDITSWAAQKDFTVKMIMAIIQACQKEPALNAWFYPKASGRRLLSSVHVGLAVDTPEGLFVPVIHEAQEKNAAQLRQEIELLKTQVRERTIDPQKMHGASIVLSNFGKFAGRYANPIILPPTVAIIGVGALREAVLPIDGVPAVRTVLPLSLSFDHRVVTGGEATRFLGVLMDYMKNPK